ncbi:MAG TPA: hypothetical protein PLK94_05275 [Alphaproteobacteria bacterium]|nr:hypothetical protein [Alphaproteobacteria bacterium]HOO50685.1 hypothetical protein [Alphaproteobacteria bacterium]
MNKSVLLRRVVASISLTFASVSMSNADPIFSFGKPQDSPTQNTLAAPEPSELLSFLFATNPNVPQLTFISVLPSTKTIGLFRDIKGEYLSIDCATMFKLLPNVYSGYVKAKQTGQHDLALRLGILHENILQGRKQLGCVDLTI